MSDKKQDVCGSCGLPLTEQAAKRGYHHPLECARELKKELVKHTQKPDPLGSAGFELLSASNDPEKLRMALRNLLDASKPYLRRKKMTPRNDCAFLNSAHEKGEKLLAT